VPHIICAAISIGVPCLAQAYDDDTHFVFTFLAARASGYSSIQASRIASTCVGVDSATNTNTTPVGPLHENIFEPKSRFRIRRDFHAMLDQERFPESVIGSTLQVAGTKSELKFLESYNKARGAVRNQGQALENDLRNSSIDNPGMLLHFLQDAYAHDGYGSIWGHYDLDSLSENRHDKFDKLLPFGSSTDFLSFDPARDAATTEFIRILKRAIGRNDQMALATVEALKRWMPRRQVFRQRAFKDAEDGLMKLQSCNQFSLLEAFLRPNLGFAIDSANIVLDRISNAAPLSLRDRLSIILNSEERSNRRIPVIDAETQKQISLAGMLKIVVPASEAYAARLSLFFDPELKDVEPYLITEGSTLKSKKEANLLFDAIPYGKLKIVFENGNGKREFSLKHEDENSSLYINNQVVAGWEKTDSNVWLEILPTGPAWLQSMFGIPRPDDDVSEKEIINENNVRNADLELTVGGQRVSFTTSPESIRVPGQVSKYLGGISVKFEYNSIFPTGDIVLSNGQNRINIGTLSK
jgi:hypothetical protein